MNKVYLIGNLTRDPEMRSTATGIPVCNFSIAVNRRVKDAQGNTQTDFFNIVAWRQLAELCGKFLMKGKKVAVVGSIQTSTYEDKTTGKKCTSWSIVADEVEFLTPMGEAPGTARTEHPAPVVNSPAASFTQADDEDLPF